MNKTCTLCNFTSRSGYHFDSHLASDSHRRAKMQADNAALIKALERVKLVLQDLRNGRRGGGVMGDASIALDYVDAALAQAEG